MIEMPVYHKKEIVAYTKVDDEIYEDIGRWKWSLSNGGYVKRGTRNRKINYMETIILHRYIMGLERGNPLQVDHIDLDPLNNQRYNLRVVTFKQNAQNRSSMKNSTSVYRGVFFHKRTSRWQAKVCLDGKHHYLGSYLSEEEAGQVVKEWRQKNMPFSFN